MNSGFLRNAEIRPFLKDVNSALLSESALFDLVGVFEDPIIKDYGNF